MRPSSIVIMQALFVFVLITAVVPCDMNFYITSNGKICKNKKCESISMTSFALQTGKTVCFTDTTGQELSIHLENTKYRTRYFRIYDTSDYKIEYSSVSKCGGVLTGCNTDTCSPYAKYEDFVKLNGIENFECKSNSKCDSYCYLVDVACTWVHWWLRAVGNIVEVYKYESQIWEVSLLIKYKGKNTHIILNQNQPDHELNNMLFESINSLPILISSVDAPKHEVAKNIIRDGSMYYPVEASELNFPERDKVGDYQIQIIGNKTEIYNVDAVEVDVSFCNVAVSYPKPKIRRFRNSQKPEIKTSKFEVKNDLIIGEVRDIAATVSMTIGNIDIASLNIKEAKCEIEKLYSYGCTAYNRKPYVIFRAHSIVQSGIIKFISNCTFNKDFLSCSPDPYTVELDDLNPYCSLYMPSINKTIIIDTNIKFVGTLDPSVPIVVSDTPYNIAKHLLFDTDLLQAGSWAIIATTSFGVMFTGVKRVFLKE